MFYSKLNRIIFLLLFLGSQTMIFSEKPRISWDEYNYSFLEVYKLKRNANKGNYDDAYKLGMYYYVIKKKR